ncbi:ABC transporter permease [Actinocrispum wychmicini]|uniref:ABC-2 family transporter n=1 Tax=Actinocrispum wychmicini TaxID=1213861 RepID=A0A4V2S7E7_9PSEU|nr:ABC transporter permease [Actinocrispum wychmicini]TCO59630.1 hypothetical protein EV192_104473 [Actinocrispum wychmicini]
MNTWHRATDLLLSEWTKLRTLRSTSYTLLVTIALGVGLGLLFSAAGAARYKTAGPAEQAAFDPTSTSMKSYILAQLAVGVLGVLVVTSEWATGMIRTSVTSVPRRGRLLAAKALVFAVVALAVGQIVGFAAFFVGQAVLAAQNVPHVTLGEPNVLRAVFGCGLYLAVIGLLGVALGTILRATAGALVVLVAVTLLLPTLATALPDTWENAFQKWWPTNAGSQIMAVQRSPDVFGPWAGYGVLGGFVAMVVAIAFLLFRSRDV